MVALVTQAVVVAEAVIQVAVVEVFRAEGVQAEAFPVEPGQVGFRVLHMPVVDSLEHVAALVRVQVSVRGQPVLAQERHLVFGQAR